MRILFSLLSFTLLLFVTSGCEKTVSFDLENADSRLVVDANIENDQAPMVILSKSLNYYGTINPQVLAASFVHGAEVSISSGQKTQKLKEYSLVLAPGISLFYYTVDSANLAASFKGTLNTQYTLTIVSEGQTYRSQTTIPPLVKTLDSVWWKPSPGNPDSSLVSLMGRLTDPPGYGNYIRYFTRIGKAAFFPGFTSVYDDQVIDGFSYDAEIEKGVDRNAKLDLENYTFFKRGDTVTVKLCNIDKATFDFWRTMEYSYSSIGNPFASPTKVLGNIDGEALGYFGGYAAQYRTIIIPK